ncbi:MAG TPA: ribosomal protein S18-alanine N-acetyltransferase [Pseudomonadales bacterium]|nr:ribosomal protein S18-alanine N-acetyltransferase [Pseudomonadales bacterium]
MTLRKATLKDFDDMLFIEEQAHQYAWPESTLNWCLDQAHIHCFVFLLAGEIIGFAIYECVLDEASLLNIAVNPEYQGQGYGRRLLRESITALDTRITRIFLEVRVSNAAAQKLYLSEGFSETGLRRNYYPSYTGREDARVMELARPAT